MDNEIKNKIETLLDQHRVMTVATLRPDGWPQATTVGYVNDGLTLYFLCGLDSQKASNLARDDRVSLTVDHDAPQVMEITGLSMAGRAQPVTDRAEAEKGSTDAANEISAANHAARPDADGRAGPHLPRGAFSHFRARLLERFWPHGSCHLLSGASYFAAFSFGMSANAWRTV